MLKEITIRLLLKKYLYKKLVNVQNYHLTGPELLALGTTGLPGERLLGVNLKIPPLLNSILSLYFVSEDLLVISGGCRAMVASSRLASLVIQFTNDQPRITIKKKTRKKNLK